jgi:hypothetical protein
MVIADKIHVVSPRVYMVALSIASIHFIWG